MSDMIKQLSSLKDKIPPNNTEAEQAVLGAILLDSDSIGTVLQYVRAESFYTIAHQKIFQAVVDLYNGGHRVDLLVISEHLRQEGLLDSVGGTAYIASLTDTVPSTANVAYYAKSYDFINNILLHYNADTGISNKKNDFNGVKRVLESIKNTLNAFTIFFNRCAPEQKNAVVNIERQYVKYVFYYQILMHTDKSDWKKSLGLLPEYFTADGLLPYAKKMNQSIAGLQYELFKYQCNMELRKRFSPRLKMIIKKIIGRS